MLSLTSLNYRKLLGFALVCVGLVSDVLAWNQAQQPKLQRGLPLTTARLLQYSKTPALTHKPIKDIDVGSRVWIGENPSNARDYEFGEDVVQSDWRLMELRAPKQDGSFSDVRMIRPSTWLVKRDVHPGGTVELSIPECGIQGGAKVLAVSDCPPIQPGPGRVVTANFAHPKSEVINILIEGESKPIGSTPNHPFWSEDRLQFVRADLLMPGERLRTLEGVARVASVSGRSPPVTVYNLEVQVEHVYRVGNLGTLIHNAAGYTVIGRFEDLEEFADHPAFDTWAKSGPTEESLGRRVRWSDNVKWLEVRIARGDIFVLASDETKLPSVRGPYPNGVPPGLWTAHELKYLEQVKNINVMRACP